jgi:hypothetical protein
MGLTDQTALPGDPTSLFFKPCINKYGATSFMRAGCTPTSSPAQMGWDEKSLGTTVQFTDMTVRFAHGGVTQ